MNMDKNKNRAPKLSKKVNSKLNGTGRFTEALGKEILPKPFDDMNDLISNAILDFTRYIFTYISFYNISFYIYCKFLRSCLVFSNDHKRVSNSKVHLFLYISG